MRTYSLKKLLINNREHGKGKIIRMLSLPDTQKLYSDGPF